MGTTTTSRSEAVQGGRKPPFSIRFEEEGHQYFINEINVPSVTQVTDQLHNWATADPGVLARAAARGNIVHKACELEALGVLDWGTVDPSIEAEVRAFSKWRRLIGFRPVLVEEIVGSWRFRFAGRLDLFGTIGRVNHLVDIKTGQPYPPYSVQTAGLEIALREYHDLSPSTKITRACLYLAKDGTHRFEVHDNRADSSVFLAALQVSHYRRRVYA